MKKKISIGVLSFLMGIGLFMLVGMTPAYASTCPTGTFCAWDGTYSGGTMWVFSWSAYYNYGFCNRLSSSNGWKRWSSVKNDYGTPTDRPWVVKVYSDNVCAFELTPYILGGSEIPNLGSRSNAIGSFRIVHK